MGKLVNKLVNASIGKGFKTSGDRKRNRKRREDQTHEAHLEGMTAKKATTPLSAGSY
jgi:hypothetical protein